MNQREIGVVVTTKSGVCQGWASQFFYNIPIMLCGYGHPTDGPQENIEIYLDLNSETQSGRSTGSPLTLSARFRLRSGQQHLSRPHAAPYCIYISSSKLT